jgi:predicted acyl esterase
VRPGAVETYPVHCWSIAYRVEAGHRLRVDVCSSSYPRYDLGPSARRALHTGGTHPSSISVSVRG